MQIVNSIQMRRELANIRGRVVVGGNFATPAHLLELYGDADVRSIVHVLNPQDFPWPENAIHETTFVGPGFRKSPNLRYIPSRLSLTPTLYRDALPVNAVLVQVAPDDHLSGCYSLGIEVNVLPAAIEACRANGGVVIAQINRHMPYTGGDALVSPDLIDYAIRYDEPLPSPAARPPDPTSVAIARQVADLVPDGATIQLGIGGVPDAVCSALHDRDHLSVWSEMISDGVMGLEQSGAFDHHRLVTSFMFGSPEFYAWADHNYRLMMTRTESTNDPGRIARCYRMHSINSAMQVDLMGEANASRIKGRIYSGFGGQTDFIVGALHSRDGKAIIALPSWHGRADVSTVVSRLDAGVTSVQPSHVATEFGVAHLRGACESDQAGRLINIAHPRARQALHAARLT